MLMEDAIKMHRTTILMTAAMLIMGCSGDTEDEFFAQPEWPGYVDQIPSDLGYEPTLTDWTRVTALETQPDLCENPEQTTQAWADDRDLIGAPQSEDLDIDIRVRRAGDDQATGLLQRWGFKDDAVVGVDHRLTLELSNGCWELTRVDTRQYCRRGATEDARCL